MEKVYDKYGFMPTSKVKADNPRLQTFNENLNNAVGKIIEKQHEAGQLLESLKEECDLVYDHIDAERNMRNSWNEDSEEKIKMLKTELADMQKESSSDKNSKPFLAHFSLPKTFLRNNINFMKKIKKKSKKL